jgi:hypothetical protein
MHDFTKEELITLKNGIEYLPDSVNLSKQYREHCHRIIAKLQAMIEDYREERCDHRSNGNYYLNGTITIIPTDVYKCKYCDKFYKCIFENGQCVGYEDIEVIE